MLQSVEAEAEDAEGYSDVDKGSQCLAQVEAHQRRTGNVSHFIDAAGNFQAIGVKVGGGGQLQFLEGFHRANNRAMPVVHGDCADADGKLVASFVVQQSYGFGRLGGFDGSGNGTVVLADSAARLIAVQHGFGHAGVANDFMAQVTSDSLGPVAPEHDFLLHVQHAEAARQAFKNAAA